MAKKITKDFLLEQDYSSVGYCVLTCEDNEFNEVARKASIICRRRFKVDDVLLISILDVEEEGNAGIALTTDGIYYWEEDDHFMFSIKYEGIISVDYDSNGVRLDVSEDAVEKSELTEVHTLIGIVKPVPPVSHSPFLNKKSGNKLLPCVCYDWGIDEAEEQGYIREMYNLIADILDELAE